MTTPIIVDGDGQAIPPNDDTTPVDTPERVAARGILTEHREPILAEWARTLDGWRAFVSWQAEHYGYVAGYHTTRAPLYAWRAISRVPRGGYRTINTAIRWASDPEGREAKRQIIEAREPDRYNKLDEVHSATVRRRTALIAAAAAAALAAAVAVWASDHAGLQALALVAFVGVLAQIGTDLDRPLVTPATVPTKVEKLSHPVVERALVSAVPSVKDGQVTFPTPPVRDGPGWRADIDLPHGVTATAVMNKREELASGLRRPEGAVWPERSPGDHAGRLVLWVGDRAFADARQPVWPLLKAGQVDLFKPLPWGADQRLRPVSVPLMYSNVLIGALPGAGKTVALRVLGLGCALDPRAELHVHELKGTGDLEALEQVAYRYGSGVDDATVEGALQSLRYAREECDRRSTEIKRRPRHEAPDNKVTSELASRRNLGLHPLVVIVDECHELFEHPTYGKEAGDLATKVIKQGRADGVILLLATQRPDSNSLPTGVSANAGIRFCLRVMGWQENDMILGTSAHKNGIRATMFTLEDLGIGWMVGAARYPQIARSAYVDRRAAMRVGERARALRVADGRLSGHAAGEEPAEPEDRTRILTDVLSVIPAGEEKVWSETVCQRLAETWPARYSGWEPRTLAAALKAHRVRPSQTWLTVDGEGANRQGLRRSDLVDALDLAEPSRASVS